MIRTRTELLAAGIAASTIADRCRRGIYTRLLPETFCIGAPDIAAKCRAVTAWTPNAVLSHRTAAWLRGLLPEPIRLEATVPKPVFRRTPPWLRLYRRNLQPEWIEEVGDLPVTSAALTVMDCLPLLPAAEADRLVDTTVGFTVSPHDLLELCASPLRGRSALRNQLYEAAIHAASEPERLFARALVRRGVRIVANQSVGQYVCDFVDERSRTIIEIDGREFHSAPAVFRNDRRRQNRLILDGWLVLRYAASDVFQSVDRCADEAVEVIRRRRRSRRP